jgi:hypothetical protein
MDLRTEIPVEQDQTQDQNQGTYYWGTAIYEYEAQTDKEISFQEGEQVNILQDHGDGWSTGEVNGIQGLFPTEYVQVYSEVIDENYYTENTDYYNQDDAYGTSEMQKKNEEAAKKKQERKEKLKGKVHRFIHCN